MYIFNNSKYNVMAFTQEGLFGKFSGRLGSLVVYQLKGKTVVRTRPAQWTAKPSQQQQQARNYFSQVIKIIQAIRPYIDITFGSVSEQSAFRNAQSVNLKRIAQAVDPSFLSWLLPSSGTRAGAADVQSQVDKKTITITWDDPLAGPYQNDDKALILAINMQTLEIIINQQASRGDRKAVAELPGDAANVAVFLAFVKKDVQKKEEGNASEAQMVFNA
jgi:hypothetical protein